jgi:hypothetical protein
MTIDPIAGGEGEKRTYAQDHGAESFIANVEVIVSVTSPLPPDDAIVRIFGRVLRWARTKGGARFHSFEDEVDAKAFPPFHGQEVGAGEVLLPEAFLLHVGVRPLNRNVMVASVGFYPMLVVSCSLPQYRLGNGVDAMHVAKEINDVLRTSEQREIALDDDAIKTVVYKDKQAGKQLAEGFHRSSFLCFLLATRSSDRGPWKSRVAD